MFTIHGTHLDPSTVRDLYAKARDAAMVKDKTMAALTFHGLRHTFGSRLAEAGIPLGKIREWMGHSKIETTEIYVHFARSTEDAQKITNAFATGSASAVAVAELPAEVPAEMAQ